MTLLFALVVAAGVASANAAPCAGSAPISLPPLVSATADDMRAVRVLIDTNQPAAARARWSMVAASDAGKSAAAYGPADVLFSAREYRTAFRSYDRAVFCGELSELNPSAQDSGAADSIDSALQRAAAGDLAAAQRLLQHAAALDPDSIESRYFLGLVEFAQRKYPAARSAWKAAIDDEGYAQPPDGWTITRAQEAAVQRYLDLASPRSRGTHPSSAGKSGQPLGRDCFGSSPNRVGPARGCVRARRCDMRRRRRSDVPFPTPVHQA
jgi:tetratricopeptide (TPR) repeat protein